MYTYDDKKKIYENLSQLIEIKKEDKNFIKTLIKLINKEENKNLIMKNEEGYYVNFTKLNDENIEELETFIKINKV